MTKNIRTFLFFLLLLPPFFLPVCSAEENTRTNQLLGEIEEVKTRLASVEKQQQMIAAKDEEILEKLDQLRVWVHRK